MRYTVCRFQSPPIHAPRQPTLFTCCLHAIMILQKLEVKTLEKRVLADTRKRILDSNIYTYGKLHPYIEHFEIPLAGEGVVTDIHRCLDT